MARRLTRIARERGGDTMGRIMKPIALSLCVSLPILLIAPLHGAQPISVATTGTFTSPALGLSVVATEVDLPAGRWDVAAVTPGKVLEQVFVVPQAAREDMAPGRRLRAVELERRMASSRWRIQALFTACRDYAAAHEGQGPRAFSDLDAAKYRPLLQGVDRSPWPEDSPAEVKGPFYFLVPGVPIPSAGRHASPGPAAPLVLELRPYVDDGKHWVLFSDGRTERRAIDRELLTRHNLEITSVQPRSALETPAAAATVRHSVLALLRDSTAPAAALTLTERTRGQQAVVRWSLTGGQPAASRLLGDWAQARAREWGPLVERGESPVLRAWAARMTELYGAQEISFGDPGARREARTADAFSVLGGRAAVRETLQMELLRSGALAAPQQATVSLSTIKGVDVRSHPFEEMLAGKEGGRLPLADHVPVDRFFVYFARPSAVFPFLDKGGDFLFRTGSLFTQSAMDDDLKGRYLRRLGLGETLARKFLESGEVTELALITPDLFFIDGTDLTVLMRVRNTDGLVSRMKALGIVELKRDGITEKALGPGRSAFWARQGDLLLVSTSRAELQAIAAVGGASLGRSAEFRYMLTQLPLKKDTRALIYFSDPFIRRMVGPAVKIGQLRRMRARAEMEVMTAGALLFVLDGNREQAKLEKLIQLGYVPATVAAGGYRLRDDLSAVSPVWGSPAEMAAIGASAVDRVTPDEAEAYRRYVDEYTSYWRQYFDPVAMRLDDAPGGALEVSTFILPLLDSQLYRQLQGLLAVREGGGPLRVPVVSPDPVLLLSLNLTDDAWVKISGSWSDLFSRYTGISPAIFDRLGPGLHIAIQDADPIIVLGNADLLGGFAGQAFTAELTRGLPLLLSLLTRPCKIIVELQDEQATLDILRQATSGAPGRGRGTSVEFRQVDGRDAWIYALNIEGIAKIRFGIEVSNGFLVLSNIPWSQPVAVTAVEERSLNGAELRIAPTAVRQGLPGLFATQSEQNQLAALNGMAALYPLLLTVSATPEEAAARHAALFGSKPLHPGPGAWTWRNGKIESSVYGTATRWKEPGYRPDLGDFGLFEGVTRLSVNMQFEAGGLRAACRWLWKGK